MRRRTQLLRENAMKFREEREVASLRRAYLSLRTQILESKYGDMDNLSMHSQYNPTGRRDSRATSKAPSVDSQSAPGPDWRDSITKRLYASTSAGSTTLHPAMKNQPMASVYSSSSSLTSLSKAKPAAYESEFAGVYHIFNNHKAAVTRLKFANNDKSLLATCSLDGTLVICQVIPSPATTIYRLEGHQSGVMDLQWNTTNDLIVTGSLDGTSRVWQVNKGECMRVLKDTCGGQVLCCCFQPLNENMIFVSGGIVYI